MARLNDYYQNLNASYLFSEIKRRHQAFREAHPDIRLIDLGIGDVTRPLPRAVVRALHEATDEMARPETFRGYGPYAGYDFLRAAIAEHDFKPRGVTLAPDEIFISDGGKSDSANLQELFARECVVGLMDPVYPVYADSNVVAGRSGKADASGRYAGIVYLPCTAENGFQPALPDEKVDLISLCYPNNPTGAVATRQALQRWVDHARAHEAVILYDAAYEAYISDAALPRSIITCKGKVDLSKSKVTMAAHLTVNAGTNCPAGAVCIDASGATIAAKPVRLNAGGGGRIINACNTTFNMSLSFPNLNGGTSPTGYNESTVLFKPYRINGAPVVDPPNNCPLPNTTNFIR